MNESRSDFLPTENTQSSCQSPLFITCFLKGAIPSTIIRDVRKSYHLALDKALVNTQSNKLAERKFYLRKLFIKRIDELLDARIIGPHFLREEAIEETLNQQLKALSKTSTNLIAYKILSNHFHLLVENPLSDATAKDTIVDTYSDVEQVLNNIKYETGMEINNKLRRIGPVWEEENFCLEIKNEKMFQNVARYIKNNKCIFDQQKLLNEEPLLLAKTIKSIGKETLIYSAFKPGIVS